MTRILILAPTPALRAGLRAMLERVDFEVIGEAADLEALALSVSAASQPDVILLAEEMELPRSARLIAQDGTQAVVVMADHEAIIGQLRSMGLRGWGVAPRDATPTELQSIVAAAAQGLAALPTPWAERIIPARTSTRATESASEPIELTPRERDVLEHLSRGLPNKLIAVELGITEATVKFHVSAIYAKLDVASRAEAVSKAARVGLITL